MEAKTSNKKENWMMGLVDMKYSNMLQKGLERKSIMAYEFALNPDFHNSTVTSYQAYHLEVKPDT